MEAAQARLSQHLSNCHIVGNHMSWLKYLLEEYILFSNKWVISLFSEQYLIYNIGMIPSKYYKVLGLKDNEGFWKQTGISAVLIVSEAFVSTLNHILLD